MATDSSYVADDEELCPKCGRFEVLHPITGFCQECSKGISISSYQKTEEFLAKNADQLEFYIKQGDSLSAAISRVRNGERPRCACCGVFIKRAARNSVFCRDNPRCRRASRRYVYLYRERGHSKANALAIVLSELTGG